GGPITRAARGTVTRSCRIRPPIRAHRPAVRRPGPPVGAGTAARPGDGLSPGRIAHTDSPAVPRPPGPCRTPAAPYGPPVGSAGRPADPQVIPAPRPGAPERALDAPLAQVRRGTGPT